MNNAALTKHPKKDWVKHEDKNQAEWIRKYLANKNLPTAYTTLLASNAVNQVLNNELPIALELKMRNAWAARLSRERKKQRGFQTLEISKCNASQLKQLAKDQGVDINAVLKQLLSDPYQTIKITKAELTQQMEARYKKKEKLLIYTTNAWRKKVMLDGHIKALTQFKDRLAELVRGQCEYGVLLKHHSIDVAADYQPELNNPVVSNQIEEEVKVILEQENKVLQRIIRQLGSIRQQF